MNLKQREAFAEEMRQARQYYKATDWDRAFHHLERAHILGQRDTMAHLKAHRWMLKVGCKKRDARELLGQCARLLAALVFSRIWVPVGNTGGANVSALKPMPLPADLQGLMEDAKTGDKHA